MMPIIRKSNLESGSFSSLIKMSGGKIDKYVLCTVYIIFIYKYLYMSAGE